MLTTIGRVLINEALPDQYRDYSKALTKNEIDDILSRLIKTHPDAYKDIVWKLLQLGREAAFVEGATIRLSDLEPPININDMVKHVREQEHKILSNPKLSDDEKQDALTVVYNEARKFLTDYTLSEALKKGNTFALQVKSKARGNPQQLTALLTTPVSYQDAADKTIPLFISKSYADGLSPAEYLAATYGSRKSIISTKFATRDAGALGKQLGVAALTTVVVSDDCGTPYGIPTPVDDEDNIGAVLSRDVGGYPAGTVLSKEIIADLKNKKVSNILIRSPLTCGLSEGVCKQCSGIREHGRFPELGYHIGLNAANALAEQIAQASLNVKHTSGQKHIDDDKLYAGFDVIDRLAKIPATFQNKAAVSDLDGEVESISPAPQGGTYITVNNKQHYVPVGLEPTVKVGDIVEAGDQLSTGIVNPADIVKHKGLGEGRRYFVDVMTKAFRKNKFNVNRRNVEVIGKALINHVKIDEPEGLGNFLVDEIVPYDRLAFTYKPRKDAKSVSPDAAVGQYLEQPVMHYTIGTRITKSVANNLKNYGIDVIMAHPKPVGFTPEMHSVVDVPSFTDDWMASLASTYLKTRLLKDVHKGSVSNIHGLNPIPAMAKGVEFGQPKRKDIFTY